MRRKHWGVMAELAGDLAKCGGGGSWDGRNPPEDLEQRNIEI